MPSLIPRSDTPSAALPARMRVGLLSLAGMVLLNLAGCGLFSGSGVLPVSENDRIAVEASQANLSVVNIPLMTHPTPGRPLKTYTVAFDGTLNDRHRVPKGERMTVVGHISAILGAKYHAGAGMQGVFVNYVDALLGTTSPQLAERAALDFGRQANAWLAADPTTEIRVFVTGFSRGAATARHFMNVTRDRWVAQASHQPKSYDEPHFYALLFDTVSTGQSDRLNLNLPESLDYLVHIVATDEPRPLFQPVIDTAGRDNQPLYGLSSRLPPDRVNLMLLPGAHSDIGASYSDGVGDEYVRIAEKILYKLGLSSKNCWDVREDPYRRGKHDPRGLLDVATGRAQPNSDKSENRPFAFFPVQPLPPDRRQALNAKLMRLAVANAERGESTVTSKSTEIGLRLAVRREGDVIRVQSYGPDLIDPGSFAFSRADGVRKLRFHYRRPYQDRDSVLVFPDHIWRRIKPDALNELSYSTLHKDGKFYQATHVNGVLADLAEGKYGDAVHVSSSDFRCGPLNRVFE